jgi:hypothetical protein
MEARRRFLTLILTAALVRTVGRAGAFEGAVRSASRRWIEELKVAAHELRARRIRQIDWQARTQKCLGNVELEDLLAAIDFETLASRVPFEEDHETQVRMPTLDGEPPEQLGFGPYFFALKEGVSVVPHGHHNLVTMHMVLRGQAHGRHFDRVQDEPDYITIKPTLDETLRPGAVTTISDQQNNVHWFTALSGPVFMFNMQIGGITPGLPVGGRDYLDPAGEKLPGGLIRARRLSQDEAFRRYGRA